MAYMHVVCESDYRDAAHKFLNSSEDVRYGQSAAQDIRWLIRQEMLKIHALEEYNSGHRITDEEMVSAKSSYTNHLNREVLASLQRPLEEPFVNINQEGSKEYIRISYLYSMQQDIKHREEYRKKYALHPEGTLENYLNRYELCGIVTAPEEKAVGKQLNEDRKLYESLLSRITELTLQDGKN